MPAPPPPPSISLSILLLRTSISRALGLDSSTPKHQPPIITHLRVPGTGKIGANLGKKTAALPAGCGIVAVKEGDKFRTAFLDAVQSEMEDLIKANHSVKSFQVTRQTYESNFGKIGYDDSNSGILDKRKKKKKTKKDKDGKEIIEPEVDPMTDILNVVYVPGVYFGVAAGPVCATTGEIETLTVSRGERDSMVVLGRDCSVTVSFTAGGLDAPAAAVLGEEEINKVNLKEDGAAYPAEPSLGKHGSALNDQFSKPPTPPPVSDVTSGIEKASIDPNAEMVVNPWDVAGEIDYNKLIEKFGSQEIDIPLLLRIESAIRKIGKVTTLHPWIRRSIFFSHRDMNKILDCVESGKPFYLYTGRGPSSAAMHLGHLVPFMMTRWLQEAFDVPLVVQMTDDEKFLWKGVYNDGDDNLDHYRGLTIENAKDIIACGFIKEKTFLFSDCEYVGSMYPNIVRIWKSVTYSTAKAMFGFEGHSNIGQSAFPAIQAAPSFPSSFPVVLDAGRDSKMACLIPCAIDQDPYFRMTRDVAHKLTPKDHPLGGKPALFHSKFFPPLQGATGKMSSSDDSSAIFLTDDGEEIARKIKSYAYSGGQETSKLQKEKGANLEMDVSYQWLRFFLDDDAELEKIGKDYGSGSGEFWATGMVKNRLIGILQEMVKEHQERRSKVTNEVVGEWMEERKLSF
ncbi:hypothetical protein TrLO_g6977 [Triparma laevis f. longispina]|uniref:Tryptophan--tRNA ligase, cytoplasmic n=2 Tax=Triparma laevis TaxID=1534972 RepID=A0A9W7APP2_9STRA|nr:hypothetical protein TrLO_g6977 [Triparma laevis f. longispina]